MRPTDRDPTCVFVFNPPLSPLYRPTVAPPFRSVSFSPPGLAAPRPNASGRVNSQIGRMCEWKRHGGGGGAQGGSQGGAGQGGQDVKEVKEETLGEGNYGGGGQSNARWRRVFSHLESARVIRCKSHTSLTQVSHSRLTFLFFWRSVYSHLVSARVVSSSLTLPPPFFALFVEGGQLKSHTPTPLFCTLCFLPLFTTPAFFDLPLNVLFSDGGLNSPA